MPGEPPRPRAAAPAARRAPRTARRRRRRSRAPGRRRPRRRSGRRRGRGRPRAGARPSRLGHGPPAGRVGEADPTAAPREPRDRPQPARRPPPRGTAAAAGSTSSPPTAIGMRNGIVATAATGNAVGTRRNTTRQRGDEREPEHAPRRPRATGGRAACAPGRCRRRGRAGSPARAAARRAAATRAHGRRGRRARRRRGRRRRSAREQIPRASHQGLDVRVGARCGTAAPAGRSG